MFPTRNVAFIRTAAFYLTCSTQAAGVPIEHQNIKIYLFCAFFQARVKMAAWQQGSDFQFEGLGGVFVVGKMLASRILFTHLK